MKWESRLSSSIDLQAQQAKYINLQPTNTLYLIRAAPTRSVFQRGLKLTILLQASQLLRVPRQRLPIFGILLALRPCHYHLQRLQPPS
jgi:hypothetical protein